MIPTQLCSSWNILVFAHFISSLNPSSTLPPKSLPVHNNHLRELITCATSSNTLTRHVNVQATSPTPPSVQVGGTYPRPNTGREQLTIDTLYERIAPAVENSVQLALIDLVQRSDGAFEHLETLDLDKRGEIVTSRCFQTELKKALRGSNVLPC